MSLDTQFFYKINHLPHNKFFDGVATVIHYLTYYGWFFAIPILYYFFSGDPAKKLLAKQLTIAIVAAGVINDLVLQMLIARPRPFLSLSDVIIVGKMPTEYSFPSGHAAIAFAFAATYILAAPRDIIGYLFLLFACVISVGRIYMGFHYPSDVLGGFVVGILCAFASILTLKLIG